MSWNYCSVYIDKKQNVLIMPRWKDEDGVGRNSKEFIKLEKDFNNKELGDSIINALKISQQNKQENKKQKVYEIATGIKSWSTFAKQNKFVSVGKKIEGIYTITRMKRTKDNSYLLNEDDLPKYQKTVEQELNAEELGKLVMEMFDLE